MLAPPFYPFKTKYPGAVERTLPYCIKHFPKRRLALKYALLNSKRITRRLDGRSSVAAAAKTYVPAE